ncbi:hypothetical protein KGQ34_03015, partial [Patescibacteria group bacterium]|nr:hypothetical protein [Patescibacteria group bacterium]
MNFQNVLQELKKPYILILIAALVIFAASLAVNFVAIPNMLHLDQLHDETVMMKAENPQLFSRDYLYGSNEYLNHYNPFIDLLFFLNRFTGRSEQTYRDAVPIAFFIFTFGMFLFLYELGVPFFFALVVALVSATYIGEILRGDFGIPGPSGMVARWFTFPFFPYLFLLFYKYWKTRLVFFVFFAFGILGIIHQVSAFYITLILGVTLLLLGGINLKNIGRVAVCGACAALGILPFIIQHWFLYPAPALRLPDAEYIKALWIAHPHMSPWGMLATYKGYFLDRWYLFWPFFAVFVGVLWYRKHKEGELNDYDRMSIALFIAIAAVTIAISSLNQILMLVFHKRTDLVHDPRGFSYAYFIFYLYLGYILSYAWKFLKFQTRKRRAVAGIVGLLIFVGAVVVAYSKINSFKQLLYHKNNFDQTLVEGQTCRQRLYDWIVRNTPSDSVFLIDPNGYP